MPIEDQNKWRCIICGGELCWDNDFNASDVYGEDEVDENDSAIIINIHALPLLRKRLSNLRSIKRRKRNDLQ